MEGVGGKPQITQLLMINQKHGSAIGIDNKTNIALSVSLRPKFN